MEQQQETPKGLGKEEQLSRIAAAVNPGSNTEASPESTKTMISTFIKHFDSVALELIRDMDDDQKDLVKNMVAEITKLQTKNLEEFEKAIGKIVGITNKMLESNDPKMQQLGQGLQDQAKEELFKAKGITLTGDKDTFANRLGREFGMGNEEEPVKGVKGVGKLAKGFISSSASGFKAGLKESFMPQGGMLDRVFTSDEDKRQRELRNLEQNAGETETESLADMFKKVVEQMLKDGKDKPDSTKPKSNPTDKPIEKLTDLTDDQKKRLEEQGIAPASENDFSYRKDGKPVGIEQINKALAPVSSEQQEDAAGISADNATAGMAVIGASLAALQSNSDDSLEIFKDSFEKLEYIAKWIEDNGDSLMAGGAGGGGGGGILDTVSSLAGGAGRLLPSAGALATGAAVTAGVAGVAYGAYKGYTGYQDAKKKEGEANKEIDEKVSRGEMTQAQGLEAKDKTKKTGRVEKSKAVGEGAGIAAGAAGGAALGAMYGSALGPIGTAVGGVGGALVGGFIGGGGGKWLGEKAGQVTNWWKGDSDKASAIDEKVKKGEISKAEGDKLKKELKPSGKDKVVGAAKATMGFVTNPLGTIGNALFGGDEEKPKSAAEKKEGGILSKLGNFAGDNKGKLIGAALGPVGMHGGALYDKVADKKTAKPETGKNVDGAIIEAGTAATKDKMKINVPPPTVINQGGGGGGQSAPNITAPGGVGNVRSDDPTWLRFQQRRAVA